MELTGREEVVGLESGSRLEPRPRSTGDYQQNQTREIQNGNNSMVGYAKVPKVSFSQAKNMMLDYCEMKEAERGWSTRLSLARGSGA